MALDAIHSKVKTHLAFKLAEGSDYIPRQPHNKLCKYIKIILKTRPVCLDITRLEEGAAK